MALNFIPHAIYIPSCFYVCSLYVYIGIYTHIIVLILGECRAFKGKPDLAGTAVTSRL